MKQLKLTCTVSVLSWPELSGEAKKTIEAAKEASERAYAPYSHFQVGAAVLLADGTVVTGNNQENAAYPSGLCAERVAVFTANSLYPDLPITTLAIAAQSEGKFQQKPVTPCGNCRQVLLESEKRHGRKIDFYFYGTDEIYYLRGTEELLPLSFSLITN